MRLGYEWNPATGRIDNPVRFDLSSHTTMLGPTRCGKGATLEIVNLLLGLHGMSVISIDPTAQNASVCGKARVDAGSKVLALNPKGLHVGRYPDLASCGCNPMVAGIDIDSPNFYEEAVAIADAFDWSDKGDRFFPDAGRDYTTSLIMHVRRRDGDNANLSTVLQLMMDHEEIDENGKPTKGPRYTAAEMVASGHFQIAALAGRFLTQGSPKTIDSIRQTAQTAARSLLSDPIRADLSKNGIDWGQLTETPTTVFVILPAEDLQFHAVWLKLIVSCALNAIYRKAGNVRVNTLLMLSEFFAVGALRSVQAAMGQGAKYGVRVWPVLQDIGQLQTMFGDHGAETFIANSGCVFAFTPGDGNTSEFLSRYAGEHAVEHVSVSDDPQGGPPRISVDVRDERIWPPHKIRNIPKFHGLVWKFGNSVPQPVYCPPYWEIAACRKLARQDPYQPASSSGERRPSGMLRKFVGVIGVATLLAGGVALVPRPVVFHFLRAAGLMAAPAAKPPAYAAPPHRGRRF